MSENERKEIAELWFNLARMYGKEIPPAALTMMLNAVEDLPFESLKTSLHAWASKSKIARHPLPAELREMVNPEPDVKAKANFIAGRIRESISKFGYTNPSEASAYIGPDGWKVISRSGGWQYICENHGTLLDPGIFHAQIRDQLEAELKFGTELLEQPLLDAPQNESQRQIAALVTGILG